MKIFRIRKKFILNPVHPFILRILIQTEKILNRVNPFILKILIQTFEDKNATLSIIHINSGKLLIIRNYTYNYSFTTTPDIKLVFGQSFNGAYAKEKNTIYLSQEFVAANLGNFGAVTGVLLEEFGHYLDSQINVLDAAGDEGDIFSQLVRGESISDGELLSLKAEDDTGFITVSDDLLSVEFSSSNWRVELYNNISRTGTPVLVQDWGDGSQGFSRDWGNGSPHWAINSDNFSLRATTQRYFAPGRHEIQTTSDDGVKVNIAGQTIIDRLVDQATVTNTGIFDAGNGGTFTTIVDYYERGGGANLNFTTRLLQQSVVNLAPNQPQSGQLSTSDRN
ncbi:PA14 domain-containing protein, partial [Trichormus sp. NMC-1]|uniref:PA14 domain-containing protein n=1 Tax=Trichormus sp. NMC-1 TaxID=1853259 RepID=UPI000A451EA1